MNKVQEFILNNNCCKEEKDNTFIPYNISFIACNTDCNPESITEYKPIEITFCVCPVEDSIQNEEDNCYWVEEEKEDYSSYLLEALQPKKHILEFPCDAERNLQYEHRIFILSDYPPLDDVDIYKNIG